MKIINQNVEVLQQEKGLDGLYKIIELAGRTCYSEDTEILTNSGWKKFSNLRNSDIVLSYNPDNNSLIWDTPNVIKKDINDEMIEITHANIKLNITKDHRIYQSIPCKRDYSFLTAEQLAGLKKINHSKQTRFRLPKYFINSKRDPLYVMDENKVLFYSKYIKCSGRKDEEFKIEVPINKDFMVFLGAYISEGHTNHRNKFGSGNNCQITQDENSELYSNVLLALDNLNWKYNIREDPRKPNIKWIIFGTNSCWTEFFDNLVGKGSKNKHLPSWFRELPDEYLNILVHNLYLGDGSHNITRKERYLSISKTLLDELQQVFILLGKNATYTYDSNIPQRCSLEESTRDSWIIDRKKHIKILPKEKRTVYCTSTKSGIICIRYKNKTSWCGNCYKSENKITETSAKEFVNNIIKNDHGAMLEHGTVYLYDVYDACFPKSWDCSLGAKYEKNKYSVVKTDEYMDIRGIYITTNYRVLIENGWLGDLKYMCKPTKFHEKRFCFKITTDRGISHELVRHKQLCVA